MDDREWLTPVIINEAREAGTDLTTEQAREYARRCLGDRDDIARPASWIRARIRNHPEELADITGTPAPPDSPGRPSRPPWCGDCDPRTRLAELDDGRIRRCPACHPLRGKPPGPTDGKCPPPVRDVIHRYAETAAKVRDSYAAADQRRAEQTAAEEAAAQIPAPRPVEQLQLPEPEDTPGNGSDTSNTPDTEIDADAFDADEIDADAWDAA